MISVLVADDHKLIVEAMRFLLERESDFKVYTEGSYQGVQEAITTTGPFDVILLDLRMPGMMGISSVVDIVDANNPGATAVFSGEAIAAVVQKCIKQGARGYIPKSISLRSLPTAIRLIATGQVFVPPDIVLKTSIGGEASSEHSWSISDRELLTLRMAADGRTNKEIAWELDSTEMTVKMIMRQVCAKLNAKNRAHAVMIAHSHGLI